MSIWDALTGRKSQSQTSSSSAPAAPSAPSAPAVTTTSPFQPTPFDPSTAQGVDAFLGTSSFADPSQLHPLAGLNRDTLDYLNLEDSALSELPGSQSVLPSRGFTDDLCYGTGTTYLAGLTLGGAWGLQEGLRKSMDQPPKLRLNSVLNSVTRRGPFLGNSAGVVAICYNCINSYIGYLRGKNDAANTIVAGALSGMLFKSTRGLRPMMISGGIVASVAGVWAVGISSTLRIPTYGLLTFFVDCEEDILRRSGAACSDPRGAVSRQYPLALISHLDNDFVVLFYHYISSFNLQRAALFYEKLNLCVYGPVSGD